MAKTNLIGFFVLAFLFLYFFVFIEKKLTKRFKILFEKTFDCFLSFYWINIIVRYHDIVSISDIFIPGGHKIGKIFATMLTKTGNNRYVYKFFVMLSSRFQNHVKRKVKVCQQSNRCLAWAKKNLALVACWMIVACHLKEDISCIDESKCLLANPSGNKFYLQKVQFEIMRVL